MDGWTNIYNKQGKLIRRVEQNMNIMLETLNKIAESFIQDEREVPQEVGQILGCVQQRRSEFIRMKDILIGNCNGPGVKKLVKEYLENMGPMTSEVSRLLLKLVEKE